MAHLEEEIGPKVHGYAHCYRLPLTDPTDQHIEDHKVLHERYNNPVGGGDAGPPGPEGPEGPQGPQGDQGIQGDMGPAGADGADGAVGTQGTQGVKGDTGDTGPQGPSGSNGSDGVDGRTVLNGPGAPTGGLGADGDFYIDTDADAIYGPKAAGAWGTATPLVGPQGATGAQGAQGNAGPQGVQGDVGAQGIQGDAGDTGAQGAQGDQGLQGIQGPVGPEGPQGDTGAAGPQGPQGPQGDPGVGGATVEFFQVFDDNGAGQTTTGTFADVTGVWSAPTIIDAAAFSFAAGVLTINKACTLEIGASVNGYESSNNRLELHAQLMYKSSGGSFGAWVAQSNYAARNNTQRTGGTWITPALISCGAGDQFKLQVKDVGVAAVVGGSNNPVKSTYITAKAYS